MTDTPVGAAEINSGKVTLVATEEDVVTFARDCQSVELVNVDGPAEIWFTTDGSEATVGGKQCNYVPAVAGHSLEVEVRTAGPTEVHIISDGTPEYVVSGSPE